jgi:hypothetical protein
MFLPIVAIARSLGDSVNVDRQARSVEVQRQTGTIASFSAQLNQVRENGSVILVVSNTADIVFPPNQEELMLPIEIIAPLLDVSIIVDHNNRSVRVRRGPTEQVAVRPGTSHGAFELYEADYTYNSNRYSSFFNQNLTLRSTGRLSDGRFNFLANFAGGTAQSPLSLRNGVFSYDRPNGQRLIAGDFGTGNDLQFLSSSARGMWAQQPFSRMRITAFGGRSASGQSTFLPPPTMPAGQKSEPSQQQGFKYDTNMFGSKPLAPRFCCSLLGQCISAARIAKVKQ